MPPSKDKKQFLLKAKIKAASFNPDRFNGLIYEAELNGQRFLIIYRAEDASIKPATIFSGYLGDFCKVNKINKSEALEVIEKNIDYFGIRFIKERNEFDFQIFKEKDDAEVVISLWHISQENYSHLGQKIGADNHAEF